MGSQALTDRGSASALAESHHDPKKLWVGTDDGALWMTRDAGANWIDLRLELCTPELEELVGSGKRATRVSGSGHAELADAVLRGAAFAARRGSGRCSANLGSAELDRVAPLDAATMKLLHEANFGAAVYTTPVAKDGVMYLASRTKLFALEAGIPAKTAAPPGP